MLNPSAIGHDVYDFMEGNISDFYNAVDDAIVKSECVKGQYRITTAPSYNSTSPVKTPNFTTLGISSSGPIVVDLENSYITAEPEITLSSTLARTKTGDTKTKTSTLFVGWKSAFEAIRQYDILVNSSPIYTQSFAGTESFIQDQILTELVKNTSPYTYTSYEQVQKLSPNVCGTYIEFGPNAYTANTDIKVKIPIKILLSQFLILRNLKYLCSWMGKWELRIYFNWENLVVAPVKPSINPSLLDVYKVANDAATTGFTQVGDKFKGISEVQVDAGVATVTTGDEVVNATKMETDHVEVNLATFQLRMDVNEELKARYSDKPLTFPVNTLQISRFSGPLQWTDGNINTVLCQAVNNCDTVFILFPKTSNERTVFRNPKLKNLQLYCGEFGAYPQQPIDTFNSPKFLNMCGDSLNVNSSPLTSFNKDTACSLLDNVRGYTYTGAEKSIGKIFHDDSNFFVGIPFSIDDDFQGGLSSPSSNINFKLIGTTSQDMSTWDKAPAIAAFLIDGSIMVKPDPMGETARVIYTDRTIC